MGNCFSDPSEPKSKGQRLGSAPSSSVSTAPPPAATTKPSTTTAITTSPGRALGDGFEDANRARDPREMSRIAAEERAKSSAKRGVQSSNPKAGQLTAKLEASKKKPVQATNDDSRPMDPGNYN